MGQDTQPLDLCGDLDAAQVILLMNQQYRISRTRRAEWFFTRLNTFVEIPEAAKTPNEITDTPDELDIISILPKNPPSNWNCDNRHKFRYRICTDTIISVIAKKYRFVYCIDISPSVASVDAQTSMVLFDGIFDTLKNSMTSLSRPFYIPGSRFLFRPKIYVTIIAHLSFLALNVEQVLVQGVVLSESTCSEILKTTFTKLQVLESKVVKISASSDKLQASEQMPVLKLRNEDGDGDSSSTSSISMSPDFALVDLFRHAVIALSLLPENSTAGLIVVTDGTISVPDGGYLDMVLSQLRYNTISCSFIQLSSPFHPHVCFGILPYIDFMKFIANATCGAFLTSGPNMDKSNQEMSAYHEALLFWRFQNHFSNTTVNSFIPNRPGVWSVRNKCFSSIRDMPVVKKQQYEITMVVDYLKVLSCRLREGFTIKEVNFTTDNSIHIKLTLAWKFLIYMEYILITQWPPQQKVTCVVSIEGPYDFLHDVTCLAKKPFHSYYRQLMVSRFWGYQKNLSESDKLLVHFNSFSTSPIYYNIPDSLRNGVPLFCISSNNSSPVLQSSDFGYPQFAQFWKPVSLLDTNIWQKWMHTHRIGILLEHDHPFPKHLHMPNSSGRFHVIQCRQTMMALNTLLKDWSSFVLVENHSYIKLMYNQPLPAPPFSFCLIRTTTKPPCLVLRLAFLVGTPGHLRYSVVSNLIQQITGLTFPQRLNEPPKWRIYKTNSTAADSEKSAKEQLKPTWSDMPCCILLKKPVEKILIRYERVPSNFFQTLLPQQSYNTWPNSKRSTAVQSTFGFRPTYTSSWGSSIKMGPEMFNTVARYLTHKRWIWCVQSTPTCPLSMDCAARILSTITKMRLQEGLRFAFSAAGIINMIKELDMTLENPDTNSTDSSSAEPWSSPCVFQYVIFPPITSLYCADGEEESEKPLEETELYLVCEYWVEPQSGRVSGGTDLDGLKYSEIHDRVFKVDQESISALVTFEHMSLMCQNLQVPSPSEVPQREPKRPSLETADHVQCIPFTFDMTRILPKSQQMELLFSTFNQILPLRNSANDDSAELYDQSNMVLYSEICTMLKQTNDREVVLTHQESGMIHEYILSRNWKSSLAENLSENRKQKTMPKWRCFIKGISENHVLVTFIPASFNDLKMVTLNRDVPKYITQLTSEVALEEELCYVRSSFKSTTQESSLSESVAKNLCEGIILSNEHPYSESPLGRKRIRVKSGGESGPVSKKALTRKTSIDNIFRLRIDSGERPLRIKQFDERRTNSGEEPTGINETSPVCVSQPSGGEKLETSFKAKNLNFDDMKTQFGSVGLPIYIYDCSLAALTDHIIFRSNSSAEDKSTDFRYSTCIGQSLDSSGDSENDDDETKSTHSSPLKRKSPEPKSEDSEFLPSDIEAMQKQCHLLELGFMKAFVYGTFGSLQAGQYIYRGDVELALKLSNSTKIGIDTTEFMQAICCHVQMASISGDSDVELKNSVRSVCTKPNPVHRFIQKRFQSILLSTFEHVPEVPGVFFFKSIAYNLAQLKNDKDMSRQISQEQSFIPEFDAQRPNAGRFLSNRDLHSKENPQDPKSNDTTNCIPLFMYLTCNYRRGETAHSFLVQQIPMCIDEMKAILATDNSGEGLIFDDITTLNMEFVFLTAEELATAEISKNISSPQHNEPDRQRKLPSLPDCQLQAVNNMIQEVEWLLRDEITSMRGVSSPLNEHTLSLVAAHVERSSGRAGCRVASVPLNFLHNAITEGFEKFKKRFSKLSIDGFELKEEGSWYYLTDLKLKAVSSVPKIAEQMLGDPNSQAKDSENNSNTVMDSSGDSSKKVAGQDSGANNDDMLSPKPSMDVADQTGSRFLLTTPSEMSSLVESVTTTGEEGYEGDGSESGEDGLTKICQEFSRRNNAFWMIFKLTAEQVKIFFHCRYNEDNLSLHNYSIRLCERIVKINKELKRLVNQDLLLQELETTRQCNLLLENDEEFLDYGGFASGLVTPVRQPSGDSEIDPFNSTVPGIFACPVVWETKFVLHSRLRVGLGKSFISRGMQTLKAALLIFEVVNRKNMFVFKDSSGNVFYLRLYRLQDPSGQLISEMSNINLVGRDQDPAFLETSAEDMRPRSGSTNERELAKLRDTDMNEEDKSEDVVLLQVHGISPAGSEIRDQLVQSLRNKLDDAVLEILFITIDRNPHCKLTPEDVHFIQKPNSVPDFVVKCQINEYEREHLPAFGFYMHQNLLNFFSVPKYSDIKLESHFRDYSREANDKNIYLYKQNPGDAGSRGIACLIVTIVDAGSQPLPGMKWTLPSSTSAKEPRKIEELLSYVNLVREVVSGGDNENNSVMVELQVWKQGRINLDLLKSYLSLVIKYSTWDLIMEFNYLPFPLAIEFPSSSMEKTEVIGSLNRLHDRRGSANTIAVQPIAEDFQLEPARSRSVSFSAQTSSRGQQKSAALLHRGSVATLTPRRSKIDPLSVGLSTLETGDKGQLHPMYVELKRWFNFGNELAVPSLRVVPVDLNCRYPVEIVSQETVKLINTVMTEVGSKQFWKSNELFLSLGEYQSVQNKIFAEKDKQNQDLNLFITQLNQLKRNEENLVDFFKDSEEFNPNDDGSHCIIVARNLIHWKACVSPDKFEAFTPDGNSHHYRFPPLMSAAQDKSFIGLKVNESTEVESTGKSPSKHPIVVPRQKLLWAYVTNSKILFIFYNWSKDSSDRLIDHAKRSCAWFNAKSSLLTSLYSQKSGLFHNQALIRGAVHNFHSECGMNPYSTDLDAYILHQAPPKSVFLNRTALPTKKSKISHYLLPCLDSIRNTKHQDVNMAPPADFSSTQFKSQFMQLKLATRTGSKNYQDWLQGTGSSMNSDEVIDVFKKSARLAHFCMTPVIFFPRWRREVAATRDCVTGIRKKAASELRRASFHALRGDKHRHDSESSQKSLGLPGAKGKRSSLWPLWSGSTANLPTESQNIVQPLSFVKKTDDKWHSLLCESFMKEYVQYLQTLAFTPISAKTSSLSKLPDDKKERVRQISGASMASNVSSQYTTTDQTLSLSDNTSKRVRENSGQGQAQFLQKSLPGGIILYEVGFDEPFFYTKVYALETSLQNSKPFHTTGYQDALTFLEECETVKTLMHLHSFTYDFHLRSIHAYIAGRQVPFKPGYHLTNFLDDFSKYYAKPPSFARNVVHIGSVTLQNVSTPSHILYDYLLTHDKLYQMKVLSSNLDSSVERNSDNADEYVLVKLNTKKVTYNQVDTERQYDEFDLILLVAYDAPLTLRPYSTDPSVLRLKYYIILTSRRDVYPTLGEDIEDVDLKLSTSNPPDILSNYRVLTQGAKSYQWEQKHDIIKKYSDNRGRIHQIDSLKEARRGSSDEAAYFDLDTSFTGIKEELIHYMGYFSSHEKVMQQILTEEIRVVESFIYDMVQQAAIDCRRDLLWQRLLIGEKSDDRQKNQKQDLISRETVGALSYWEFGELLELVEVKSLSEMDPRLFILLRQPVSFYQNLIRLITLGSLHHHRYFVAPDETTHQVALFCNRVDHAVIMLEICFEKRSADLSILFKNKTAPEASESPAHFQTEILSLIESVINLCCYCAWGNLA